MTRDELMQGAAEKAVAENDWETIEWLFKPTTQMELLLRWDFDGMRKKITEWFTDMSPSAMPHRHLDGPYRLMRRAVEVEEFYRKLVEVRAAA